MKRRGKEYTEQPMTTGDLIRELKKLDPTGKMPVALRGSSGSEVRPLDEISTDMLLGCTPAAIKKYPENRFFAMLKRYDDGIAKKMGLIQKYKVVFID